jgi:hypothetical protein
MESPGGKNIVGEQQGVKMKTYILCFHYGCRNIKILTILGFLFKTHYLSLFI